MDAHTFCLISPSLPGSICPLPAHFCHFSHFQLITASILHYTLFYFPLSASYLQPLTTYDLPPSLLAINACHFLLLTSHFLLHPSHTLTGFLSSFTSILKNFPSPSAFLASSKNILIVSLEYGWTIMPSINFGMTVTI